ncbi:MAG: MoxR family ATPase [Myxococcota bacterium]|nr:MoxR family ATPase [Myxococcota bacterium]
MSTHDSDHEGLELAASAKQKLLEQVSKQIVGQETVIQLMLTSLLARGHCLFVGVPGLAKTLLVNSTAQALSLGFNRIQFTPDLMPSDITGTEILEADSETGRRHFKFVKGPIFTNLLLADEINRTPPKTQAALLQAMQERVVTAAGQTYEMTAPFMVFATQNPIEQEGTYPLPEAQLDRFMMMINVDYPSEDEEVEIVRRTTVGAPPSIEPVLTVSDILTLQELVKNIPVSEHVIQYAVKLARSTRPTGDEAAEYIKNYVGWGAGPRASQFMILAGKARALLDGRLTVSRDDIKDLAIPILRHRVVTNFNADAERIQSDDLIRRIIDDNPTA